MPRGDADTTATQVHSDTTVSFETPDVSDGARLWQLARDSQTLDVNSRYSYLLWCHDFASTSVVARVADEPVGFITGYRRPQSDDTLFVWQVAVSTRMRRQRLARRMLDHLFDRLSPLGVSHIEATVTPDNLPSARLFASFAREREAELTRDELFSTELLGEGHQPEMLYRIGPMTPPL